MEKKKARNLYICAPTDLTPHLGCFDLNINVSSATAATVPARKLQTRISFPVELSMASGEQFSLRDVLYHHGTESIRGHFTVCKRKAYADERILVTVFDPSPAAGAIEVSDDNCFDQLTIEFPQVLLDDSIDEYTKYRNLKEAADCSLELDQRIHVNAQLLTNLRRLR